MSLLTLPPEIRYMIYSYYFPEEGGYFYNHDTGKLSLTDRPIPLSLLFTCRLIAEETAGLPLQYNTITFTTDRRVTPKKELKQLPVKFEHLIYRLDEIRCRLMANIRPCITPKVYERVTQEYPSIKDVLDDILLDTGPRLLFFAQEMTSSLRAAFDCIFRLANVENPQRFATVAATVRSRSRRPKDPRPLWNMPQPWTIPTNREIKQMYHCVKGYDPEWTLYGTSRLNTESYIFSAASSAAHFLKTLSPSLRLHLRSILLCEDARGVASAACHARGLIPFCQENAHLKVKRRVSLWRCIWKVYLSRPGVALKISKSLNTWLVEALALGPAGMPPGAFALVLDGEVGCFEATSLFEHVIQKERIFQKAFAQNLAQKIGQTPSCSQLRSCAWFVDPDFPAAMDELSTNTEFFRYNFSIGEPPDLEDVVRQSQDWTLAEWNTKRYKLPALAFDFIQLARDADKYEIR